MKKIALISTILEEPEKNQKDFNELIGNYKGLVKGRMGLPFDEYNMAVISITVVGTVNEINSLTGKIGNIPNTTVKTAFSKKEIGDTNE